MKHIFFRRQGSIPRLPPPSGRLLSRSRPSSVHGTVFGGGGGGGHQQHQRHLRPVRFYHRGGGGAGVGSTAPVSTSTTTTTTSGKEGIRQIVTRSLKKNASSGEISRRFCCFFLVQCSLNLTFLCKVSNTHGLSLIVNYC